MVAHLAIALGTLIARLGLLDFNPLCESIEYFKNSRTLLYLGAVTVSRSKFLNRSAVPTTIVLPPPVSMFFRCWYERCLSVRFSLPLLTNANWVLRYLFVQLKPSTFNQKIGNDFDLISLSDSQFVLVIWPYLVIYNLALRQKWSVRPLWRNTSYINM